MIVRRAALGLAVVLAVAGCGRQHRPAGGPQGPSCRGVAQAANRWIDAAPEAERARLLRFAVEVIDLCQAPGLSATTRKCVAAADSASAARLCPALPLTPDRPTLRPLRAGARRRGDGTDEIIVDSAP